MTSVHCSSRHLICAGKSTAVHRSLSLDRASGLSWRIQSEQMSLNSCDARWASRRAQVSSSAEFNGVLISVLLKPGTDTSIN